MRANLVDAFEERWADYLRLSGQDANYSAFIRLSEIANLLQFASSSSDSAMKWAAILESVTVSPSSLRSLRFEAEDRVARLVRIIGGSGSLAFEEMLLVITLRVELELLSAFLAKRGFNDFPNTGALDKELFVVAEKSETSAIYRSAREAAKRNWGIPLHSKWLGNDSVQ